VKITVKEAGPLVASLLVECEAPGCNKLTREVRLVAGTDHVEITNTVDKKRAEVQGGKPGDWAYASREAKEGVHFGFGFNVPDGVMRMDIPYAVARPEVDQIPGACKNWFTVQRWVDVSNADYGVTWATIDAPLVQVGAITANLLGSQTKPDVWINRLEPSQTFYSWAMNNHWHTNYRAYQEGPTVFRYAIRPHRVFSPQDAARFGTSLSQPLTVAARVEQMPSKPRLTVDSPDVLVTAFKPADNGHALIVRLFGASGRDAAVNLRWSDPQPAALWLSNTSEKPLRRIAGPIDIPAWGIVTLRAEMAK
jgi:alpha-mannosidase